MLSFGCVTISATVTWIRHSGDASIQVARQFRAMLKS
jgi:hypothetical protein